MNAPSLASLLFLALPLSQALAQSGALRPVPGQAGFKGAALPLETALASYEGFVEVQRAGEQTRRQVTFAPFPLADGDRVHTFRRGEAVIRFKDGSRVTLGPYTVFTIEVQDSGSITLSLGLGRLRALVAKLKGREFKVRTAVAVASVRGTEFEVGMTAEGLGDVAVHDGLVAVANLRGDEVLLAANQRLEVFADRMGRVEHFEGRPERGRKEDAKKPEKGEKRPERREPDERRGDRGRLKEALEREIGHHLQRDAIESNAAFEHKSALYQEGKTLIDAFGHRVRLEQFITRPDPSSFKQVTLNFRDQRFDFSFFEVTANKPLPPDLRLAKNLWFSPTATPPEFFAVKQRWVVSNTIDSVVRLSVDGRSVPVTFQIPSLPICVDGVCTFGSAPATFHQTIFGNSYEFINGDPMQIGAIYANPAVRPLDAPSMMWHMQPVKIDVKLVSDPAGTPLSTFWRDVFVYTNPAAKSGKMFVESFFQPDPSLAHFVENRDYINFVDNSPITGGIGFLSFGEPNVSCAPGFECFPNIFHDQIERLDGTTLVPIFGAGSQQAFPPAPTFFSDANGNGINDIELSNDFSNPFNQGLALFAKQFSREHLHTDTFVIDDLGHVFNFLSLGAPAPGTQAEESQQLSNVFERLNFQRVFHSSLFQGRKIDIVLGPHIFIQSGQLRLDNNQQGAAGNLP